MIQYESNSREGLRAAAIAGLGMTALFRSFEQEAPPAVLLGLPELGSTELFMRVDQTDNEAVCSFAGLMIRSFEQEAPPAVLLGLPELGSAELFMRVDQTFILSLISSNAQYGSALNGKISQFVAVRGTGRRIVRAVTARHEYAHEIT